MTTQRIRYAKRGDHLSAGHYNKVIDGANRALDVLGPPVGRRPGNGSVFVDENGELDALGSTVFNEVSRVSDAVRIVDPNDSSFSVTVERIRQVTMESSSERITLVFDW